MAIFGKKKEKGQQESGNNAGSPPLQQQEGTNGVRSPPVGGTGSRDGHSSQQQHGLISHGPKSSISGTTPGSTIGPAGMGNGPPPNGMVGTPAGSMRGPNGRAPDGTMLGAAGGFKFGGPPPRPDNGGQSGIPVPGGQMRSINMGPRGPQDAEAGGPPYGPPYGPQAKFGPPGSAISGIPPPGSIGPSQSGGGSGLPPSSTQGPPIQPRSDKVRTEQVTYPWSQRGLVMNPPRFLDETRQAPPGALSPSPFPRYGHAANAHASASGEVYLFGGLVRESVKNDLYVVQFDENAPQPGSAPSQPGSQFSHVSATLVQTKGEIPPPRVGHATVLVFNVLILWGGDTKVRADDKQDEGLYLLNLSSREWTRVRHNSENPDAGPVGRYGHTVAIVGSRFYVFGGQVDGTFMNDLWTFDLNSLKSKSTPSWELLKPTSELPPRRTGHASVTFEDKIYIFGGTDGQYHYNDTWCYDVATNSWKELSCIGYIPVPREGHAACLVDDVMYIFGGRGVDGKDLSDLASFRIPNQRWYMFANMGPCPSGRSGHALTTYQNKVVVLGGESFTGAKADDPGLVHVLNTAKIKYPPDGGSKTIPASAALAGRRSNIPGPVDGAAARSMSPTERATSPTARSGAGGPNESLMGLVQKPTSDQPSQQVPQGLPPQYDSQSSRVGRGIPLPDGQINRAVSPAAAQRAASSTQWTPGHTTAAAPPLQIASTASPANQTQSARSMAPTQGGGAAATYTGPKSQRSLENMRNGATSPLGNPALRGNGPDRGANVTSPTAQDGFHYGGQANGVPRGASAYQSTTSPVEIDMLRKREAWMKSALAMAVKKGFVMPGSLESVEGGDGSSTVSLEDIDTGSDGSEKERVLKTLISLKSQLANAKATIAQQATGEAERAAANERARSAALSEAAYYRAKLEALESGNNVEADLLQRGRNADVEKQLSITLRECSELEKQLTRTREELKLEQQLRTSADERLNETSKRAVAAEASQLRVHEELSQLQTRSYQYESQLRDHKEKVATLTSLVNTHQSNHQEAQRKLDEYQGSDEKHHAALKGLQASLASLTARASEHEHLHYQHRDLVQQHEVTIASLQNELAAKHAETDRHSSRATELESLMQKHRDEAESHKQAVNVSLSQLLAHQQQTIKNRSADDGNTVPLHAQEKMRSMQEEAEALRSLHLQSKQTADEAHSLLNDMRERNLSLKKQHTGLKSELNAMHGQLSIALQEVARLKEHHQAKDHELQDARRTVESAQVKHGLMKQIMVERGVAIPGDEELSSPQNGYANQRIQELEEQLDNQTRELHETEHRLQDASSRVEELNRELEHANSRTARSSLTAPASSTNEAMQRKIDEAHKEKEAVAESYRERMSQLEADYQTAVQFVKGSEKMLRKMKDELTKYKTDNTSLQSELVNLRSGNVASSSGTEAMRDIEALRTRLVQLTHENETVTAENRELERKMTSLNSEQRDLRDKSRNIMAAGDVSGEGGRRAKELESQVGQLEESLEDVRKELQETLTLNTHLSTELNTVTKRSSVNGTGSHATTSATLAKDLTNAQTQNEQLRVEKNNLAQRLQEAEDKLQLLLGRMEGTESDTNPGRDSQAFSISSELDKWERDRATDAYSVMNPSSSQ